MTKKQESTQETIKFDPKLAACKTLVEFASTYKPKLRGGTGGDNAIYGQVLEDSLVPAYKYPCHRQFCNPQGNKLKVLWSVFCKPNEKVLDPKIVEQYFQWITDPEISPWRSVVKLQEEIEFEGSRTTDPEFRFKHGFVFTGLDQIPSNLLMNFFVATRMAKEWPNAIKTWAMLVNEYKIDPAIAMFYIRIFYNSAVVSDDHAADIKQIGPSAKNADIVFNQTNFYDWPLDASTGDVNYFSNFCFGNVVNLEYPMTEAEQGSGKLSYTHINNIWGRSYIYNYVTQRYEGPSVLKDGTYTKYIFDTYSKEIGEFKDIEKNALQHAVKGKVPETWRLTFDNVLSIMTKEQERLARIAYDKQTAESGESKIKTA